MGKLKRKPGGHCLSHFARSKSLPPTFKLELETEAFIAEN